jgi:uncharacterized protein YuzE
MTFQFDQEAHAVYVRISELVVHQTLEVMDGIYLDVSENEQPVGLEFVNADDFFRFFGSGSSPAFNLTIDETRVRELVTA